MVYNNEYLAHYGVKGMKWGVRNFQDSNGHLTKEGRQRYKAFKKEVRAENEHADKLKVEASNYGKATYHLTKMANRSARKADKALVKDPYKDKKSTLRKIKNAEADKKALDKITKDYRKKLKDVQKHANKLIDKYGKEHVSDLKFKEKTVRDSNGNKTSVRYLNEMNQGKNAAITILSALGAAAMADISGVGVGYMVSEDYSGLLADIYRDSERHPNRKQSYVNAVYGTSKNKNKNSSSAITNQRIVR